MGEADIPLAEMVQALRRELEAAQKESPEASIRFETEKVELELKMAVSKTAKGSGGIKFWVVNAGGELEKQGVSTHTFRLTLVPKQGQSRERVLIDSETENKASGN